MAHLSASATSLDFCHIAISSFWTRDSVVLACQGGEARALRPPAAPSQRTQIKSRCFPRDCFLIRLKLQLCALKQAFRECEIEDNVKNIKKNPWIC